MAIDLHTSLPSSFLPDDHHHDNYDFLTDLTHRMPRFLHPQDDTFDFSAIRPHSHHLHTGTPEGTSQESSPPATPKERCWKSCYDMFGTFEKMKLNERGNSNSISNLRIQTSNTGPYSYQSLIQEQIRALELSGVKQEQVMVVVSPRAKPSGRGKSPGQTYEAKKGNGRRTRHPPAGPQQQARSAMRALFLDGPSSRGGTGVFLPRAGPTSNKQGKGCSSVLIPARVVQALQLHFDQMAATSGPKPPGFPPLHDVLVSNRDGMYSLQNRQSQKAPASILNDTMLPQEWTY